VGRGLDGRELGAASERASRHAFPWRHRASHIIPLSSDAVSEKQLRGGLRSAADRALSASPGAAVIVDSLNHVKGYRYELWCVARAVGARYCVVWCPKRVSAAKPDDLSGWPDDLAADLASREEAPDPRNRWDAPLFVAAVDGRDAEGPGTADGACTPAPAATPAGARGAGQAETAWSLASVAAAVVGAVAGGGATAGRAPTAPLLAPTVSVVAPRTAQADALGDLDAALQAVVNALAAAGGATATVAARSASGLPTLIALPRPMPLAELRRAKRDYLRAVTAPLAGAPPAGDAAVRGFSAWLARRAAGGG